MKRAMVEKSSKPEGVSRRWVLTDLVKMAGGVSLMGSTLWLHATSANSQPAPALRPPGALPEEAFLGACLRCGLCVRYCPYDTLKLAEVGEPVTVGTPYFIAREIPCEMCPEIPCVKACPSGALEKSLDNIDDARMGLAVLSDQETCLPFNGLRCEVCFRVCPLMGKAITVDVQQDQRSGHHARFIPVVHSDACTGCGKCERACILPESAIRILPHNLVKGKVGEHYRFGWKEKEKAGGPLVPDVLTLPAWRPGETP